MSNGLDPDQDRRFVGPDMGSDCFQRLSADDKIATSKERVPYSMNRQMIAASSESV